MTQFPEYFNELDKLVTLTALSGDASSLNKKGIFLT